MLYEKLKKEFNNTSDLKKKEVKDITIIYLESLCSGDKINEQIIETIILQESGSLINRISNPSMIEIKKYDEISYYLLNGYALVTDEEKVLVCEVKADLYRSISTPTAETSINGPKDSFNENIVANLGLIKRRIKSTSLKNEDYLIGRKTKTKLSLLYLEDVAKESLVNSVKKKLENIDIDGAVDLENLKRHFFISKSPLPTIMKTERPDVVCSSLLEGKIAIIADNSPYALLLPAFLVDFINPEGDKYVNPSNVNFLKIIRFACLLITITAPALYISIINYNQEVIPIKLLLSFQEARTGVPFPSSFESIFMIILCVILRESDIRFPSNYGSSISILGALILGESAVSAQIASPIMIIIIGITFVTGLIFTSGEIISGLRFLRFLLLLSSIFFGLYGFMIGFSLILLHVTSLKTEKEPYLYPLAPFDSTYFFKTVIETNKNEKRSKLLSKNRNKVKK